MTYYLRFDDWALPGDPGAPWSGALLLDGFTIRASRVADSSGPKPVGYENLRADLAAGSAAETALLASTAWPADATGVGHRLGRLVPGREADLVVLDGDPLTDPLADIQVVATMVGGRWTYGAANLGVR